MVDRTLRALGLAQGAYFLWATLGGGALATSIGAGLIAAYLQMPWWSVLAACIALFLLGAGTAHALATSVARRVTPRSEAYHELTGVIEQGRRLRQRLSELTTDPDDDDRSRWQLRVDTWNEDADEVVNRVAPLRVTAFRGDTLIAEYPGRVRGRPYHIAQWEFTVESTLERLLYIRVTL